MAGVCSMCGSGSVTESEGICTVCGKESKLTVCDSGHRLCRSCSDNVVFGEIRRICMDSVSSDPYEVFKTIVDSGRMRMHDFRHHVAVGSALLAAHRNAGTNIDLGSMLDELCKRARQVPPGSCGLMGNCGAAVSVGTFLSILSGTTPYSEDTWGDVNLATAQCLVRMGIIGGPRCCKRNSIIAIQVGALIARDKFGSEMDVPDDPVCGLSDSNKECIRERCPFYRA